MPWQQHVADVALEIDPKTGRLAYREVRLTVPRQSGKTSLLLPKAIWRAEAARHLGGRQRLVYAAQTGNDARQKWRQDFVEDLDASKAMRGRYRVRLANGSEAVRFTSSGSTFSPTATTEKAGHGGTLDDGTLDEAFAQVDDRVEQAWRPAMITRPQPQFWVVSTAGTAASTYLRRKVDTGRALAEGGHDGNVAYFEWAADPDADPEDPATWWSCMPALGHTVTEDAVRAEFEGMELAEFRRAFLNQWTDRITSSVIPMQSWTACRDPESKRAGAPVLSVDVSPDRSRSSVAYAALRADGLPMVQIVRYAPGTDWVVAEVDKLRQAKDAAAVVLDRAGPAGSLIPDFEAAGVRLTIMGAGDMVQACGALYDAVVTEQLRHTGQAELDAALRGADRRQLGDAWAWKRRTSTTDISPLVAATEALWGLSTQPPSTEAWGFFE
jgi:phage terminase large subunit-like protein